MPGWRRRSTAAACPTWPKLREIFLAPIHQPFKELVNASFFRQLFESRVTMPYGFLPVELLDRSEATMVRVLDGLKHFSEQQGDSRSLARQVRQELEAALQLPVIKTWYEWPDSPACDAALKDLGRPLDDDPKQWAFLFAWLFTHALGKIQGTADASRRSRSWLDEWLLGKIVAGTFRDLGLDDWTVNHGLQLVELLTTFQNWFQQDESGHWDALAAMESLFKDGDGQQFLGVNRYDDIIWFTGQALEELLDWFYVAAAIQGSSPTRTSHRPRWRGVG